MMQHSRVGSASFSKSSKSSDSMLAGHNHNKGGKHRRVVWSRCCFVASLCGAAALLGYLAHRYSQNAERELAQGQFESLADRVLDESILVFRQKRLALVTMASMIGQMHPDASAYPFVAVPGFEEIATHLIDATSGVDMGWGPVLYDVPAQLSDWEAFAYNYYYHDRVPPYPNNTAGMSPFGWGVWTVNFTTEEHDRYHDTEPETLAYNSSYPHIKCPLFQLEDGDNPILMQNMHARVMLGSSLDGVFDCVHQESQAGTLQLGTCGSISVMFDTWKFQERGPSLALYQPIFPRDSPDQMLAFIGGTVRFDAILENSFAETVSGIDCVFSSSLQNYTYTVTDGFPNAVGYGDLRSDKSKKEPIFPYGSHCIVLNQIDKEELYRGRNNSDYTLCLYPTDDFLATYATNNPATATVFAVLIIVLTSMFFFLYDLAVRREFTEKKNLLAAKRRFIRFVSHEVRTPLNAVCMGLAVVRAEIASSLGYKFVEELERADEMGALDNVEQGTALEWFHLCGDVLHSAKSAADVLSDLLNYDKITNGEIQLELTVLPIWQLVEETLDEFKLPATKKNIRLELEFRDDTNTNDVDPANNNDNDRQRLPVESITDSLSRESRNLRVVGDSSRVTLSFRNLLSNAIKFTPDNGCIKVTAFRRAVQPPKVAYAKGGGNGAALQQVEGHTKSFTLKNGDVVAYPQMGEFHLTVRDSGAGMSKDQLANLFQDGVQFDANALQAGQGSGLGLFITKGLVVQHGGTLTAHSCGLQKGSTFELMLPLYKTPTSSSTNNAAPAVEDAATATTAPADVVEEEVMFNRSMRILVVDDTSSNRKLLGRLLTIRGHEFEEAEDGQVGLEKVEHAAQNNTPYDTVLLDYEMPRLCGPDTAKKIREMGHDVFIVGVTGNLMAEDVQHFLSCGANAVLPKPFSMRALDQVWMENSILAGDNIQETPSANEVDSVPSSNHGTVSSLET